MSKAVIPSCEELTEAVCEAALLWYWSKLIFPSAVFQRALQSLRSASRPAREWARLKIATAASISTADNASAPCMLVSAQETLNPKFSIECRT